MYADDTTISVAGNTAAQVETLMNADLISIKKWLESNKLTINVTKTEYILIGSSYKLESIIIPPNIMMGNEKIDRVKSSKCVGVYIDETLSWNHHTDYLSKKISRAIGGLKQVRRFVPTHTLITIYKALIQPLFDYCDVVWSGLNEGLANRLQKLQNRAARIITQSSYEIRSAAILERLGWDNLAMRRFEHKVTMMYKVLNNNAPAYLQEQFKQLKDSVPYNLRNADVNLALPKPNSEYLKKSFGYSGGGCLELIAKKSSKLENS